MRGQKLDSIRGLAIVLALISLPISSSSAAINSGDLDGQPLLKMMLNKPVERKEAEKLLYENQLERILERVLEERLRLIRSLADPLASLGNRRQLNGKGEVEVELGQQQQQQQQPMEEHADRERRLINQQLPIWSSSAQMINLDSGQMSAIESLNSLLDDDNPSRLGRTYKPRTMSTARGFGKRSSSGWRQSRLQQGHSLLLMASRRPGESQVD